MSIDTQPPPSNGIARFILGLSLIKEFSPALLRTEFVVAITVFAILVPSAMAYGDLAGVTPVAGLYVALGAMVMYALFGTSKQLIMGPEATAAIMTTAAVAPLAGGDPLSQLLEVASVMKRLGQDNIYVTIRAAMMTYHAHFGAA